MPAGYSSILSRLHGSGGAVRWRVRERRGPVLPGLLEGWGDMRRLQKQVKGDLPRLRRECEAEEVEAAIEECGNKMARLNEQAVVVCGWLNDEGRLACPPRPPFRPY